MTNQNRAFVQKMRGFTIKKCDFNKIAEKIFIIVENGAFLLAESMLKYLQCA